MKQLLILVVLLALATVGLHAAVPQRISYQGRVTGAGGALLSGTYSFIFSLCTDSVLGTAIWTETQTSVPVTNGLYSVQLGAVTPIPDSVFNLYYTPWLDVIFNGTHLTKRTKLTTVPYAFRVNTIDGARGGVIKGYPRLTVNGGPMADTAALQIVTEASVGNPIKTVIEASSFGTFLKMYGSGSSFPSIELGVTNMGYPYASLPTNSIDANETSSEPGIAASLGNTPLDLTTSMQDLTTVTLQIPDSGYIVLSGRAGEIDLSGTTGENWAVVQIDETVGGGTITPYGAAVGGITSPDTMAHFFTASTQRTYKKSAGTYTFRLEALRGPGTNPSGHARAFYPMLTAVYYPTKYGTVVTAVSQQASEQINR